MRSFFVYLFFIYSLIWGASLHAAGTLLEVDVRDAREPYRVAVVSLQSAHYGTRAEPMGAVTRFQLPPTGYVFVEIQFASGYVLARTVQLPEPARQQRTRVVFHRADAVFAKDLNQATKTISAAALANERQVLELVERFEAQMEAGSIQEAEAMLWELLEIQPGSVLAWNNLGAIALAHGELSEATSHFQRAFESDSGSFEANLNLSRVHITQGNLDLAQRYSNQALKIRPDHPSALAQRAQVMLLMERYLEAKPLLETLLRVDPHHGSFPELGLSVVMDHLGEPLEASRYVMAWAERHPRHPENDRLRQRARAQAKQAQTMALRARDSK